MHLLKKKVYIELGREIKESYHKKYAILDEILFEINEYTSLDIEGLSIHLDIPLEKIDLLSDEDKENIANAYLAFLSLEERREEISIEQLLRRRDYFIEYLQMIRYGNANDWLLHLEEKERTLLKEDIERYVLSHPEATNLLIPEDSLEVKKRHYIAVR